MDLERGYTFWSEFPHNNECLQDYYNILYKGLAVKTESKYNEAIIYTVNSNEYTFSLKIKGMTNNCNRKILKTEHPKLFIFENNNNFDNILYSNDVIKSNDNINFDLSMYVNSKFVYVERHFGTQLNDLYINLLKQQCEVERKTIQNSLALATLAPDEFAFDIMKKPGYIARVAGEVVHLLKCIPREVKVAHIPFCFEQLPVTVNNETWFLTPKTHILTRKAKQVNCNAIIPIYYKINKNWIKFMPKPTNTVPPNIFKPNTGIQWTYKNIDTLATSGVYSQQDLQSLQDQIMFPMEKAALLNTIARQMKNQEDYQSEDIKGILTENTVWHIITRAWEVLQKKLLKWGSYSSIIIMLIIIGHIFKLIFDAVIRGYTLHNIYGFSIYLLGAIFSSITHLLVLLYNRRQNTKQRPNNEELREIRVIPTNQYHERKEQSRKPPRPPPMTPAPEPYEIIEKLPRGLTISQLQAIKLNNFKK